jgi:hypothetical protein
MYFRVKMNIVLLYSSITLFETVTSDEAPKILYAQAGKLVELPCATTTAQNVTWMFRDKIIVDNNIVQNGYVTKFAYSGSHKYQHNLIIFVATSKDNGVYECRENLGIGKIHKIRLHVEEGQSTVLSAQTHENAVLPCHSRENNGIVWDKLVTVNGSDNYDMIIDDDIVQHGFTTRISLRKSSPRNHDLVIVDVQESDAGIYRCIEDLGIGTKHLILLNVKRQVSSTTVRQFDSSATKIPDNVQSMSSTTTTYFGIALHVILIVSLLLFGWCLFEGCHRKIKRNTTSGSSNGVTSNQSNQNGNQPNGANQQQSEQLGLL